MELPIANWRLMVKYRRHIFILPTRRYKTKSTQRDTDYTEMLSHIK